MSECILGMTYGVEEGVALNLGGTTAGVVDVVTLHGDEIAGSVEVDTPVVVAVAGGGVVADTVDEVVGEGHALGGISAEDDVLTGNASGGDVVNPDHVSVVDGDGITSPDVLGVDIGEGDVPLELVRLSCGNSELLGLHLLDDNVAGTADDADTLTLDDTGRSGSNEGLVGLDGDTENTGVVAGDG